jgi:hypothetical protein
MSISAPSVANRRFLLAHSRTFGGNALFQSARNLRPDGAGFNIEAADGERAAHHRNSRENPDGARDKLRTLVPRPAAGMREAARAGRCFFIGASFGGGPPLRALVSRELLCRTVAAGGHEASAGNNRPAALR